MCLPLSAYLRLRPFHAPLNMPTQDVEFDTILRISTTNLTAWSPYPYQLPT